MSRTAVAPSTTRPDVPADAPLADSVRIGLTQRPLRALAAPLRVDEALGLVVAEPLRGQVLWTNPYGGLYETRATVTPRGDLLLLFPDALPNTQRTRPNGHYGSTPIKVNRMLALRSRDAGRTWSPPVVPFDQPFNQHGFVPLIPRGTTDLLGFGTQPSWERFNGIENAPIGWRTSVDDGHTWGEIQEIRPQNDPDYTGMSVMRMTETTRGSWIIGTHTGSPWYQRPDGSHSTCSRQYLLRSTDRGASWTLVPGARPDGWYVPASQRMDELRPIALDGDEVFALARTTTGRLWQTRSRDDGATWEAPRPTTLVHPDAPPMLFASEDGRTLIAFIHRSHTGSHFDGNAMQDRAQLWVVRSHDGGRSWDEPRFVLANALAPAPANAGNGWRDHQCSYLDVVAHHGQLHLFLPHRWQRALHLVLPAAALDQLPTAAALGVRTQD